MISDWLDKKVSEKTHHFILFLIFISIVCQLNAGKAEIENSKAQSSAFDEMVTKEDAQMEKDKQKDEKAMKSEDKMVHDLKTIIHNTEQELEQIVSTTVFGFS